MSCSSGGCCSTPGPQPKVMVEITLNENVWKNVDMRSVQAPGRTLQFIDADGSLHIIMLAQNDRVEIVSQEPLPQEEE